MPAPRETENDQSVDRVVQANVPTRRRDDPNVA